MNKRLTGIWESEGAPTDGSSLWLKPDGDGHSLLAKGVNGWKKVAGGASSEDGSSSPSNAKPDWNENDSSSSNYIANRPMYEIPGSNVELTDGFKIRIDWAFDDYDTSADNNSVSPDTSIKSAPKNENTREITPDYNLAGFSFTVTIINRTDNSVLFKKDNIHWDENLDFWYVRIPIKTLGTFGNIGSGQDWSSGDTIPRDDNCFYISVSPDEYDYTYYWGCNYSVFGIASEEDWLDDAVAGFGGIKNIGLGNTTEGNIITPKNENSVVGTDFTLEPLIIDVPLSNIEYERQGYGELAINRSSLVYEIPSKVTKLPAKYLGAVPSSVGSSIEKFVGVAQVMVIPLQQTYSGSERLEYVGDGDKNTIWQEAYDFFQAGGILRAKVNPDDGGTIIITCGGSTMPENLEDTSAWNRFLFFDTNKYINYFENADYASYFIWAYPNDGDDMQD